ncbi:MAG: hydroxyacylglutathione hydrolase [Pseudomonadota bacterium]
MFPCLSDNYGFLIHDPETEETACIDTPEAGAILAEADAMGWKITQIWNTHWHPDHAGGNAEIQDKTGCRIIGPAEVKKRLEAPLDQTVEDGDSVQLGALTADIIATPGHTLGHIVYHIPEARLAFVGDTLFALGCGRLFEGDPAQMWTSLSKLKTLPSETVIYCAHEYTAANAAFALSVDADNSALLAYADEIKAARAIDKPTVPTTMAKELATNPFLRADDPSLQAFVGKPGDAVAAFGEIRARKDNF